MAKAIPYGGKGAAVSKAALTTHLMQSYSVAAGPMLLPSVGELALVTRSMLFGGYWEDGVEAEALLLPYTVAGQTATLEVRGTLIAGAGIFKWARIVDTKILFRTIRHLRLDPTIKTLRIRADSTGGTSHWVKETAEEVDRFNKTRGKRVEAVVDRCACSAMYWIIAPAKTITITSSATLGSVGVRITLVNQAKWYEEFLGEKHLDIVSGEFKAAGTDTREPTEKELARFQAKVDRLATEFITSVAGYRSLQDAEVRAWEADTFIGAEAVEKGLADSVALGELETGEGHPTFRGVGYSSTGNHQLRGTNTMALLEELKVKHQDVDSLAVESIYHGAKNSLDKEQRDALATATTERDALKTQVDSLTTELSGARAVLTEMADASVKAVWEAAFGEHGVAANIPEGTMRTALMAMVAPAAHTDEKGVLKVASFAEAVHAEAKAWADNLAPGAGSAGSESPEGGGSHSRTPGTPTGAGYSAQELADMGL